MKSGSKMIEENTNQGHRKRLRERFIRSGLSGFQDYEIIELLLTTGSPRRDCKQSAKEAIKQFKTLRGVLEAPPQELQKIKGIGPHNTFGLKLVQEVAREFLKEKILERSIYQSAQQVFDYLYHSMRDLNKEIFKVLLLNSQNQIIETLDLSIGTVNASFVSPREVMESALKYGAVSLIFAHNHPSGNPIPSSNDKEITRDLVFAGSVMQIAILDHIIIGNNKYYSFAGEGLIEQYETEFLGLKMGTTSSSVKKEPSLSSNDPPWRGPVSKEGRGLQTDETSF
jgi:DNA repair protein RadC